MLNMQAASGDYRVQVGQSIELRDRAALEVAGQTVLPIAADFPSASAADLLLGPARPEAA
jgi:two-component system sensor histidine kinase QseC